GGARTTCRYARAHCWLGSTTTVPTMCAWMVQKYWNLPGVVKVNENLSPVSRACDLNRASLSTTVCGSSSLLIQVTVVPAGTVRAAGAKLKSRISIVFAAASAGPLASHGMVVKKRTARDLAMSRGCNQVENCAPCRRSDCSESISISENVR